jgi:EAL domain-containing protein (putative c-di-GMP-specific phosphodiesterase class I)/GGDEF domain-containing protein/CheY-like chemotaxis protein
MSLDGPLFDFIPETEPGTALASQQWKVLSVEDDAGYQASLTFALESLEVQGRSVQLLSASSAFEATQVIAHNPDISVILLDVVMEDDEAGLRLVGTIREVIGNAAVRIILLTGQPGMAPRDDVMQRYDIDDYWCKSELTNDHLLTVITCNIRTWDHLTQLTRARQGLQMVIDASESISSKRDIASFTHAVLTEIGHILGIEQGGILCTLLQTQSPIEEAAILAATDDFRKFVGRPLGSIESSELRGAFRQAASRREHCFINGYSLFYFSSKAVEQREYLVLIKTQRPLRETEINLLQVFSENISTGFTNVALYNRLTELAYSDPLLGIPNRNWLLRELGNMSQADRQQAELVVLEIDDFIDIGIAFGEPFCNDLLYCLYRQLVAALTPDSAIARIDRNSFALLTTAEQRLDQAFFTRFLSEPLVIADAEHRIAATVTVVALHLQQDRKPDQILRLAESTVEAAHRKKLGYLAYNPEFEQDIASRYALLSDLRSALSQQEFYLELQPKIRLSDGKLLGFEALARWKHPNGEQIPPSQFIPLAETSGLIGRLDQSILLQSCKALHALKAAGIEVPIAFNVSSPELIQPRFFNRMLALIQDAGIRPDQLELEITETQAVEDYTRISPYLRKLIALGMRVSIDDFGIGYSSLSHITDLAATTLKIDKSFIDRLGHSQADEQVVDMILRLGECFGFSIIAEGIETEEQRIALQSRGCLQGQGYLFARPMPLSQAIDWARSQAL